LSFGLGGKTVDNFQFMAAGTCDKFKIKTATELIFNRQVADDEKKTVHYSPSVKFHLDTKCCEENRGMVNIQYNHSDKKLDWQATNEYSFDKNTKLKAKINQNYTLTMALIHKFAGFASFGFTANMNFVKKNDEKKIAKSHLKYKFGASLEFVEA